MLPSPPQRDSPDGYSIEWAAYAVKRKIGKGRASGRRPPKLTPYFNRASRARSSRIARSRTPTGSSPQDAMARSTSSAAMYRGNSDSCHWGTVGTVVTSAAVMFPSDARNRRYMRIAVVSFFAWSTSCVRFARKAPCGSVLRHRSLDPLPAQAERLRSDGCSAVWSEGGDRGGVQATKRTSPVTRAAPPVSAPVPGVQFGDPDKVVEELTNLSFVTPPGSRHRLAVEHSGDRANEPPVPEACIYVSAQVAQSDSREVEPRNEICTCAAMQNDGSRCIATPAHLIEMLVE